VFLSAFSALGLAKRSKGSPGVLLLGLVSFGLSVCGLNGCGARSRGKDPEPRSDVDLGATRLRGGGAPSCATDEDCVPDACATYQCRERFCVVVTRKECPPSTEECVANECNPVSGACDPVNATPDADGDGFYAARLGVEPGAPGSCGDDCDDTDADSFTGGIERGDGHDNDCDGFVDEEFELLPPTADGVLISTESKEGTVGGLLNNGELFALSFSRRRERNQTLLFGMRSPADVEFQTEVVLTNSDSYAGPVLWTGRRFVTTWEDRRDEDFEIYWNSFDRLGRKMGPDLRLSVGEDFSLRPSIVALGEGYAVFWQDRRNSYQDFQVYAQRIDGFGELQGDNVNLTEGYNDSEDPSVAVGDREIGLVFNTNFNGSRQVLFRRVSFDLARLGDVKVLSPLNAVGASISFLDGKYVVLWHEYGDTPGDAIWGTVVDRGGESTEPQRVTDVADFARGHNVLALGDRLLLLWSEYRGSSYELYIRTLAPDLTPLTDALQVTYSGGDVVGGAMALGDGALGVAYTSYESGAPQVYFTTLPCR
jgi:hypothetical protein